MSSNTTNAATNTNATTQPINNDYEYIQYNEHLRIIHSKQDDMYQMQSIINACNSNKLAYHYFENQSTKDVLDEFELEKSTLGIPRLEKSYEKRDDLPVIDIFLFINTFFGKK